MSGLALGLIGSAVSGIFGARSADNAADAAADGYAEAAAVQREIFETNTEINAPRVAAGDNALAAQLYLLGMGPAPMVGGTTPEVTTRYALPAFDALTQAARDEFEIVLPRANGPHQLVRISDGQVVAEANNALALNEELDRITGSTYQTDPYEALRSLSPEQLNAMDPNVLGGLGLEQEYMVGGQAFQTLEDAQAFAEANPEGQTEFQGFQESPGYQFRRDEAMRALEANQSSRGMRYGGNALAEAMTLGDGLAAQEFTDFYNRIAGVSGTGQAAATTQMNLGQNYANALGGAAVGAGNASASGYMGVNSALQRAGDNALAAWGMHMGQQGGYYG